LILFQQIFEFFQQIFDFFSANISLSGLQSVFILITMLELGLNPVAVVLTIMMGSTTFKIDFE
jgi:hypothetical protein